MLLGHQYGSDDTKKEYSWLSKVCYDESVILTSGTYIIMSSSLTKTSGVWSLELYYKQVYGMCVCLRSATRVEVEMNIICNSSRELYVLCM